MLVVTPWDPTLIPYIIHWLTFLVSLSIYLLYVGICIISWKWKLLFATWFLRWEHNDLLSVWFLWFGLLFSEFHSMVVRILFDYLSFDPCEVLVVCGLAVEDDLVVWRFSNFFFSQSLLFGSVTIIFSLGWYSTSCFFYVVYNSLFVLRCRWSPSILHYVVDICRIL